MSEEKQCECCHEWWYDSDVKENLCPNCYDYFKQLKQQLEEKEKQIDIISRDNNSYKYNIDEQKRIIDDFAKQLKEKDNYRLRYELAGADETITNLKQQLAEKQNTIDEINKEFVKAVHDWKALCAEKDKEIEMQKNLFELNNEVVINQGKEIFDLRVQVLQQKQKQNQTQLAIQELERVKILLQNAVNYKGYTFVEIYDAVNNQIRELRGE